MTVIHQFLLLIITCGIAVSELLSASAVDIAQADSASADEAFKTGVNFRVESKSFRGPKHLEFFKDFCMRKQTADSNYLYTICPYHNVTQLDSSVYGATEVAVGTWQGWLVKNNSLVGWHFYAGDPCSGSSREAKVIFTCGPSNVITKVTEPQKCSYEFTMEGPTFCNHDALTVYPYLSHSCQHHWDLLYSQLTTNGMTQEAYADLVEGLLQSEGWLLSQLDRDRYKKAIEQDSPQKFNSLETCEEEFLFLKKENKMLRSLISKDSLASLDEQLAAAKAAEQAQNPDHNLDYRDRDHHYADYGGKNEDL